MSSLKIFYPLILLFLTPLANGQQLVRPLGRDTRCRGEIVFQKKPADLDDPENFLNSTSFSAIDCAVKCYQRVPGCRGVRYDHTKNICMYSSKDQGNCFRTDVEPKVSANDRMLTMYCIQCIERNQTERTDKPNKPTPAAVSTETTVLLSKTGVTIGNDSFLSTTRSTLAPQTPQFAGQKQVEQLVPQNRILEEINRNSIGGSEKLPVVAQQQAVAVQGQPFAAPAPATAPTPLSPPATVAAAVSLEPSLTSVKEIQLTRKVPQDLLTSSLSHSSTTGKPAVQNSKNTLKVSHKPQQPAGNNQTAEYDYYYNENENETLSSISPKNLDGRNSVAPAAVVNRNPNISVKSATPNNTFVDDFFTQEILLATQPTVRKINALPEIASGDAFDTVNEIGDNKTSKSSVSKIAEIPLSSSVLASSPSSLPLVSSSLSSVIPSSSPLTSSKPLSLETVTSINISSSWSDKNDQQPIIGDQNSTTSRSPIEVTAPPENVQVLHTFNETSGSFGADKKGSTTDNSSLIAAAAFNESILNSRQLSSNNEPQSIGKITGQLNPIDLSSVTPDPSCREEDILPCSKHIGRECIVVKPGRCPLCFCPYRSPAKGCAGPSGLNDVIRNELIQGKRNCPNGEPAQTVFRYERKIDKEKKFDNCIRTVQPYCGPEQDLFWQMPRFVNDCYYYCYTDKELRARGFANITTYDRKL